jgi:hypothetical protein
MSDIKIIKGIQKLTEKKKNTFKLKEFAGRKKQDYQVVAHPYDEQEDMISDLCYAIQQCGLFTYTPEDIPNLDVGDMTMVIVSKRKLNTRELKDIAGSYVPGYDEQEDFNQ